MKLPGKLTRLRLLGLLMFFGIIVFALLIWRDFSLGLSERWAQALAAAIEDFEAGLARN